MVKIDRERRSGIQLPGISTLLFARSNCRLSLCMWKKPIRNPQPKVQIHPRIGNRLVYLVKNVREDKMKKPVGTARRSASGTLPVFLALRPTMIRIMNKGHTKNGVLVRICSML